MAIGVAPEVKTPQSAIEKAMQEILHNGVYEAVYLFSNEGLPLALAAPSTTNGDPATADRIAELAILFHDVRRMAMSMGDITSLREVNIEGVNRRKIVFRFFKAFEQDVVLAAVVPSNKAYRKVTNELEKLIVEQSF
jgi:hypothetical protein